MSVGSGIVSIGRPVLTLGQGDPNKAIKGTKRSGPRGIEAIFEYNGLHMNVRDWIDTYVITNVDGIDDADLRDSREANPDDHGETPYDPFYGGRTVVFHGHIRTKTIWKLRDMQQALRAAFADIAVEHDLIFRSDDVESDLMIRCRKSSKIMMGDEQRDANDFKRTFQIPLRASNPRFLSMREEAGIMSLVSEGIVQGVLVNRGNFRAQPTIKVYGPVDAPSQGAIGLRLVNETNGEAINFKAPPGTTEIVPAGSHLELVMESGKRSAHIRPNDVHSSLHTLAWNRIHHSSTSEFELEGLPYRNDLVVESTGSVGSEAQIRIGYRHTVM